MSTVGKKEDIKRQGDFVMRKVFAKVMLALAVCGALATAITAQAGNQNDMGCNKPGCQTSIR